MFIGTNSDLIQGLTDFVQLLLWLGAAGLLILRLRSERAKGGGPPRSYRETTRLYLRFLVEKHHSSLKPET